MNLTPPSSIADVCQTIFLTMAAAVDDTSHEQEDKDAPGQVQLSMCSRYLLNTVRIWKVHDVESWINGWDL